MRFSLALTVVVAASIGACRSAPEPTNDSHASGTETRTERLDRLVPELLVEHRVAGVGIALIENGNIAWTGYYGEQSPGIPVTSSTVFNSASVAKTVTAETLIALEARGLISFDEPIFRYVKHPDLQQDERFKKLTPRMLLSHRGGLLNWPYEYDNGRAAFVAEPGSSYSYSGMGVDLAAQYAESKLGKDFELLAFEYLFDPIGVTEISLGRIKPWMAGRLATPMNSDGNYFAIDQSDGRLSEANNIGEWSGADDLLSTVDAYAKFLTEVMESPWLDNTQRNARMTIFSSLKGDEIWNCIPNEGLVCAENYGHSLGWMVYKFTDTTIVTHGGNDAGENALVIYSPETGTGAVILVNGGNGIFVSTQILGLLGDYPDMADYYRQLVSKFYGIELPALQSSSYR